MASAPELDSLTREQLIEIVRELQSQRVLGEAGDETHTAKRHRAGKIRTEKPPKFDMSKYRQRHIALHVAYVGTKYHGLAIQEGGPDTIETKLFEALERTRLITHRSACSYSRCGRTDKGVSALGQVVALHLRSNLRDGVEFVDEPAGTAEPAGAAREEIDYPRILNRVLPADIRVLGCAPVPRHFSARFSCESRTYRYYFVRGTLDIQAMCRACALLCGVHDYRNFAKLDVVNVTNFVRAISGFTIHALSRPEVAIGGGRWRLDGVSGDAASSALLREQPHSPHASPPAHQQVGAVDEVGDDDAVAAKYVKGSGAVEALWDEDAAGQARAANEMMFFQVQGTAFLWHQVRKMVAVLLLVGAGREQPEVVRDLLDTDAHACTPMYQMAPEAPLNLFECTFPGLQLTMSADAHAELVRHLNDIWYDHAVETARAWDFLQAVVAKSGAQAVPGPDRDASSRGVLVPFVELRVTDAKYVNLLGRERMASYEDQVARLSGPRLKRYTELRALESRSHPVSDVAKLVQAVHDDGGGHQPPAAGTGGGAGAGAGASGEGAGSAASSDRQDARTLARLAAAELAQQQHAGGKRPRPPSPSQV